MAKKLFMNLIRSGVKDWNQWRKQHPDQVPDLKNAYLRDASLSRVDLRNTILQRANFLHAILNGAKFSNSNLRNVNFQLATVRNAIFLSADLRDACFWHADLQHSDFSDANLYSSNLTGANCKYTTFENTNLRHSNLAYTNLQDANLTNTDFQGAYFYKTFLDSMHQLNDLNTPLTPQQLLGCVFAFDEAERESEKEAGTEEPLVPDNAPRLVIRFTRKSWRPIDMALALLSLELAANRVQTLCTPGQSEKKLKNAMRSPCYPAYRRQGVQVASAHASELEIVLAFLKENNLINAGLILSTLSFVFSKACKALTARKEYWEGEKAKQEARKLRRENQQPKSRNTDVSTYAHPLWPEDYSETLSSRHELCRDMALPAHTLSQANGHSSEFNSEMLEIGMREPLAFIEKQYRDGYGIAFEARNFDPNDYLSPLDGPFGPENGEPETDGKHQPRVRKIRFRNSDDKKDSGGDA